MKAELTKANEQAETRRTNKMMMWLSSLLGLTTGIGVVAWGAWSLLATIGLTIYERTALTPDQILIEDAFNQGMLQSAMLIALGAIILELRRIGDSLDKNAQNE